MTNSPQAFDRSVCAVDHDVVFGICVAAWGGIVAFVVGVDEQWFDVDGRGAVAMQEHSAQLAKGGAYFGVAMVQQ